MIGLTRQIAQDNASKMVCLLLAAGTLTACKHNTTPTMDTKGLWIANGTNVIEYIPSQLTGGGTGATVPHLAINSAAFGAPQGVTFDKAGNLWVMDPEGMVNGVKTPALFKFTAAQLAALKTNSTPDPAATITSTALAFPQQSVFDANGNQWVSDHDGNKVNVFTAAQLAMTGLNPTIPVVSITSASFNGPLGIVFDAAGNLWVANNGGVMGANGVASATGTTIVEFAAKNLPMVPATGMVTPDMTPDVILSDNGAGSVQGPWALAFDTAGNLWSNNAAPPFVVEEFMKTSLAMTAAPMPAVTISSTMVGGNPTLDGPNGLCFDDAGDIANTDAENAFGVDFYTKGQLMTGAPIPKTFIIGAATTLNAPAGCNFGPAVN